MSDDLAERTERLLGRFAPDVFGRAQWWVKPPVWTPDDAAGYHALITSLKKQRGLWYPRLDVVQEMKKTHANARKMLWGTQTAFASISLPVALLNGADLMTSLLTTDAVLLGGAIYSFLESFGRYKSVGTQYWQIRNDLRKDKRGLIGTWLEGEELQQAEALLAYAEDVARKKSLCKRNAHYGAAIFNRDVLVGEGANAPPLDACIERCLKDVLPRNFRSDPTCCVHAEQNAVLDAAKKHPELLSGATLYLTKIDGQNTPVPAGKPYCTICSKTVLNAGIAYWVLRHEEGVVRYDARALNAFVFRPPEEKTI